MWQVYGIGFATRKPWFHVRKTNTSHHLSSIQISYQLCHIIWYVYIYICIYIHIQYIYIYIHTIYIYIYQIIHIVFPSNNANNAIKQWLTCDPPTPPAAQVTPACNSPVPQFGGLWQPRFTMPEAPLMKELSPVFMPLSTHFFLRWQWCVTTVTIYRIFGVRT